MNVMKFGGTSLGSPELMTKCAELIEREINLTGENPLVIVSAIGGTPSQPKVTDLLLLAAENAVKGEWEPYFRAIEDRHHEILEGLGLPGEISDNMLSELEDLLRGIQIVREATPRLYDFAVSFGERICAKCFTALLRKRGHKQAEAVNSYDLGLVTDSRFMNASPLLESYDRIREFYRQYDGKLLVVTGFIAKDKLGEFTTIGRSGSDFSAAIFGSAIGAKEIQVWKDVPGVLTADPSLIPHARPLERLSFSEASELAYYGAEVLHPATLVPAIQHGIPVRVLYTFNPETPGTTIVAEASTDHDNPVKSIVYKENQSLINVKSEKMLGSESFMARLFNILENHHVVIHMLSTSQVSVSLITDVKDMARLAALQRELEIIGKVEIDFNKTIVAVVGEGMKNIIGLASRIFRAVAAAGVNLQMISQGASEINLAFLVDNKEIPATVKALHGEFFEGE
ncbi:MAG: aspartate kinase [Deltaproteobacteria bacterium]|nr:aspartate kinase [Deltaproteobacteria bacterium]